MKNQTAEDRLAAVATLLILGLERLQRKPPIQRKLLIVQAIRSQGQQPRLYVYFHLPLAAAIGLEAGEEVQWELLDRGELHLVRALTPPPKAKAQARKTGSP